MSDDALIEAMAKAVRKSQMERTGAGRAFDEALPPTDMELDNARAALAVARKAILEEAAKVASANEDKYQNPTEYDYGAQICSREIAAAIRSLATQEQNND